MPTQPCEACGAVLSAGEGTSEAKLCGRCLERGRGQQTHGQAHTSATERATIEQLPGRVAPMTTGSDALTAKMKRWGLRLGIWGMLGFPLAAVFANTVGVGTTVLVAVASGLSLVAALVLLLGASLVSAFERTPVTERPATSSMVSIKSETSDAAVRLPVPPVEACRAALVTVARGGNESADHLWRRGLRFGIAGIIAPVIVGWFLVVAGVRADGAAVIVIPLALTLLLVSLVSLAKSRSASNVERVAVPRTPSGTGDGHGLPGSDPPTARCVRTAGGLRFGCDLCGAFALGIITGLRRVDGLMVCNRCRGVATRFGGRFPPEAIYGTPRRVFSADLVLVLLTLFALVSVPSVDSHEEAIRSAAKAQLHVKDTDSTTTAWDKRLISFLMGSDGAVDLLLAFNDIKYVNAFVVSWVYLKHPDRPPEIISVGFLGHVWVM